MDNEVTARRYLGFSQSWPAFSGFIKKSMKPYLIRAILVFIASIAGSGTSLAQRQMERLGRGVVALKSSSTQIYVGWRLLGNDPSEIAFNLYRSANGAAAVKVNASPLTATTDYVDTPANLTTTAYTYSVKTVMGGVEVADIWANPLSGGFTLPVNAPTRQYLPVPIQPTPDDTAAGVSYDVKFCWVGDFDGDGEYDYLIDRTNPNVEAKQWLQAYKRNGTLLWQMDMGPNSVNHYNITPGSSSIGIGHGDNVTVYDLDGDGKAEVVVRTANGVVFPNGTTLAAPDNEVQYISIIDGLTGVEKARATVPIPAGWVTKTHLQGQMGIVYADGMKPSIFFHPSNRNPDSSFNKYAATWDYRNGVLSQRWIWLESGHTAEGHQVRFADVDNDGKDEYVDVGNVVKSDGSGQINENVLTDVVHGDRFHVADIDPDRPGLETFLIQQNNGSGLATVYSAADKSAVIKKWYAGGVVDVGRGVVGDFVPTVKGLEFFSTQPGVFDAKANQLYASGPFPPESIWWDGDLGREFLSTIGSTATSPGIDKFNTTNGSTGRVLSLYSDPAAPNSPYNNYISYGGRPQFWGDILGDWREELLCVATDNSELRIYTTKTPDTAKTGGGVPFRIYTLMQNPQYRIQATTKGYVQSSYVDYYLGNDMTPPSPPPMVDAKLVWRGGAGATIWDAATPSWLNNGANSTFAAADSVRFDISGNSTTTVGLSGTLQPSAVTVYSPTNYNFDGTNGSLSGSMTLMKSGAGTMTLSGTHGFTGKTTIWDGALALAGALQNSPVTVWGGTFGGTMAAGQAGGRLSGTGTVSQSVALKYRGAITPGTGMGNAGTLTLGGLIADDGSYLALDLSNDPAGAVTPSDRISINGNLSVSGTVGIVVKALNGQLAPGTYTLATYTGTLTGSAANFAVTVPPGTPYSLTVGSGAVKLIIPVTRTAGSIVWRGSGAAWDLASSQNWLLGGSPGVFVSGDTVTFDGTGAASPAVTLNTILPVAGVTVNSASNYTFSGIGSISGTGGLTKSGTGTLTISSNNDYTGPTVINGGILAVNSLGDAGTPGAIGSAAVASSNFIINGGTLQLTGAQTNTNRNLSIGASGGILDVATAGSSMQLSGVISGSGKLTKSGSGTLILASANSYTGGTLISSGTIYLAGATANSSALGNGTVTISNGTLSMADVQASETAAWNLVVPSGSTARVNADGRCQLNGTLTGAGDLTFYTPYVRTEMDGNWSAFTGRIFVVSDADGGNFRIRNSAGYPSAALDLGDGVYAFYNQSPSGNLTIPLGTLSGTSTGVLAGCNLASRTITWQVGARNEDSNFAGIIANATGPTALTKVGTGTLTLSGASTHTGATTVSAGRLQVTGTTSATSYTVQSGASLGGSGTITGNVTIQAGGGLEHGAISATSLTIVGNLTFAANAIVRPAAGAALTAGTYTVLTYSGALTGTPTLTWEAPVGSNFIAIFNTSTAGIITMTLAPPSRGPGPITWTGTVDFNWDVATANWISSSFTTSYQTGDTPWFTDTGNATSAINLAANVQPAGIVVNAAKDYTLSGTGVITGPATVTKSGAGTLFLTGVNAVDGAVAISGGTLSLLQTGTGNTAVGAVLGSGPITLSGGGTFGMGSINGKNFPSNSMTVPAASTGTLSSASLSNGYGGSVVGASDSNLMLSGAVSMGVSGSAQFAGFVGVVTIPSGSQLRFASTSGSNGNGGSNTTFQVDGTLNTRNAGGTGGVVLGALVGSGSVQGQSNTSAGTVTYYIGGKNIDSTFSGVIANGGNGSAILNKVGTGNLTLAGVNTYTGTTTVAVGKLSVTGSLAATVTTVSTTGTLGGTGTIAGAVNCNGVLSPGITTGKLTLTGGLALSSTSTLDYELGTVSDLTAVTGNLVLDGTVNVNAAAGFAAGTYTLITYSGTLTNNALLVGTLPPGYSASISTATANQVKLVVTAVNSPPQITTGAAASPASVTSTTATVSVAATDNGGEGNLTYAWTSTGPAAVTFSPNGTNAAKNSTGSFTAAGSYALTVTVSDAQGLTTSGSTSVTVVATATALATNPPTAMLAVNASQSFTALVSDQFGNPLNSSVNWSASGGGTIAPNGIFSATAAGGPFSVSASVASLSTNASVVVTKAPAMVILGGSSFVFDGSPKPVNATTHPAGFAVDITYDSTATVPTAPGIYQIVAVVNDPNYSGSVTGSLVISHRTLEHWVETQFTPAQILAGESAFDADPDHDGLSNLAEYALGGSPYGFTPQPLPVKDSSNLSLTFQRPAWATDVIYHVEVSPDFATWSDVTLEVLTPGTDPETVRATWPIPGPSAVQQFMRLHLGR